MNHERRGYQGITIPTPEGLQFQGGFLEMDPPEQRQYRQLLNPYLSPAAVSRWIPLVDEVVRACLDEKIETGRIDFVDDLANVVPAVLTLAMMGIPLQNWAIYCEPVHAAVYTPPDSPDMPRVRERQIEMFQDMLAQLAEIREAPRPGLIDALGAAVINGRTPPDMELIGVMALIIGGGFDTTTALTAHALEWLAEHPDQRDAAAAGSGTRCWTRRPRSSCGSSPPRRATAARSPPTARSRAPGSRRASGCGCRGPWPTATRRCSPIPTRSTWPAPATATTASGWASTAASAPTWPAWCSSAC